MRGKNARPPFKDPFTPSEQKEIDSEICGICGERYDQHTGQEFHTFEGTRKNSAAQSLGRLGGLSTSPAKSAAARENGTKGGRIVGLRKPTNSETTAYNSMHTGILYRVVDSPYLPTPIYIELTDNPVYRYEAIAPDGYIFKENDAHTILGRSLRELTSMVLTGIEPDKEEG